MNELSKQKTWVAVQELMREYPDDPQKIIARCEREAADRERRSKALQGEAIAFRQMIEAVGALSGLRVPSAPSVPVMDASPGAERAVPTPLRPMGTDAVRRIMQEGGVWTVKGLLQELKHRDWDSKTAQDPLKATEAAVSRLVTVKKEVERVGRGEYRYIGAPDTPPPESESASSNGDQSAPPALLALRGLGEHH